jgi:hypothetical protein
MATTALVGFALTGAAQAATSPLTVNLGGSVDFAAANFSSQDHGVNATSNHRDFESVYAVNLGVTGKANNGVEYGGNLDFGNGADIENAFTGGNNGVVFTAANIFMSGAFGKVQLGDSHGATDLALLAPVAGDGQVYGRYIDFLDTTQYAKTFIGGVDVTDHSTNITYFTPKVGNENNKVQAAVSYVPQFYNYGAGTVQYNKGNSAIGGYGSGANLNSPYKDVVKGALAYTGNIHPVALGLSADVISGSSSDATTGTANPLWVLTAPNGKVQSFTSFGVGAQAAAEGFTLGANYLDMGHYDTVAGQNKSQNEIGAALKYEFSKVAVGVSYLGGKGYDNTLTGVNTGVATTSGNYNYVKDFSSFGAGGSYTWAPGLTSNLDGVYFDQKTDATSANENKGYVLLVSQKLAF